MTVGDRGRLVIPAELRSKRNWPEGTLLVGVDTDRGVLLTSRPELERIVQEQLAGVDVVADLIEERRRNSLREEAE